MVGAPLRPRAGRRIPGHQPAAGVDPARLEARRPRPDGSRRRRAVDLFVPRGDGAQHPGVSRMFEPPAQTSRSSRNYRSTQPILDASNGVIAARPRASPRTLDRSVREPAGRWSRSRDEAAQVDFVVDARAGESRGGHGIERAGGAVARVASRAALEIELTRRNIPFVKFGGLKFLEAAHVKDVLAILRWAENPRDQVAGLRVLKLMPGVGPAAARRGLELMAGARQDFAALAAVQAARRRAGTLAGARRAHARAARPASDWTAEIERLRRWYEPQLNAALRGSAHTRLGDLDQLERIATRYPSRGAFSPRWRSIRPRRSATEAGPAAQGRRLADPVDDPFGQGPGMARSLRAECRRRLHTVRSRDRNERGNRGGAPAAVRGDDARARRFRYLMQPMRYYLRGQRSGSDKHVYAPRSRFIAESDIAVVRGSIAAARCVRGGRAGRHHSARRFEAGHAKYVDSIISQFAPPAGFAGLVLRWR